MVFSSNIFLFIFLPLFFALYFSVSFKWKSHVIVFGSYVFYAWWRPDFLLLFVAVSLWNYWFGAAIARHVKSDKKLAYRFLTIGVIGNLATLGYFKYTNFGVEALNLLIAPLGFDTFYLEKIILPLGISFYLFQAISYLVDVYRKNAEPAQRLVDFAAYLALFPQLIAGPIVRYRLVSKQLVHREHNWGLFSQGAYRFMLGFSKKVLIADSLAPFNIFLMSTTDPGLSETYLTLAASLIQLYFDFSAYSDMAIGLGMMMGFRFPENFRQPLTSGSLTEFWQRWHMTLGDFLRNYVLTPLVKTKKVSGDMALFLTMTLAGIWHGASFSFVIYGVYMGVMMVLERRYNFATSTKSPYKLTTHLYGIMALMFGMPLFIGYELSNVTNMLQGMLGFNGIGDFDYLRTQITLMPFLFLGISVIWIAIGGYLERKNTKNKVSIDQLEKAGGWKVVGIWVLFLIAITRLEANSFSPFLYFQF